MCSGSVGFKKTTLLNICAQWNPAKKSMRTCLLYPISVRCKHIVMRRCVEHADMANTKIQGLKLWTNMWIIDLSMSACKFRQHDWKDEKLRLFFLVFESIWCDSTIVYDVQHNETWLSNEPNAVQTKKCCSLLQPLLSTYPSQNSGSSRTDAWCHHATVAREQCVEFVVSWILDLILTALDILLGSILLNMCSDSHIVSAHRRLWHKRWAHFAAN